VSVFVDTSALYAFVDADADEHVEAVTTMRALVGAEVLRTHSHVLVETFALIQHRIGMPAVRQLVEEVVPALEVRWVDATLHGRAVSALLAAQQRRVSLVDWTSFELMRDEAIDVAFAFDDDFAAQGFRLLPAAP
jgi:uncharacterized protein